MKVEFNKDRLMLKLQAKVKEALHRGALDLQEDIKKRLKLHASNLGAGGIPSYPGQPPGKNTGALARSIQLVDKTQTPMLPTFRVGTKLPYAKIQEYGGRISPKKGKFLPVPLNKDGMRALRDAKGNLRSLNLILIRTKAGKLFLCKMLGKVAKPIIILVKKVILPPRPYFRPSYEAKKKQIGIFVELAIKDVLQGHA